MSFPFENLEVYKRAIKFVSFVQDLLERPTIGKVIANQFSRAALSVPLNIAEGNGRWHKAEKRHFFWIARGSLFECIPILEILKIRKAITEEESTSLRVELEVMGKMLTRLIQAHSSERSNS